MSARQDNTTRRSQKDRTRAREIMNQVRELWLELEELVITSDDDEFRNTTSPRSLVGSLVEITNGNYNGQRGRVTRRRGTQFWYILLESNGLVVYKQPHNFRVIASTE